jgi:hypothetical protein
VGSYLPVPALADWPVDMIRHTAGDAVADLLELPAGGRTRSLIEGSRELWRRSGSVPLQHDFTAGLIAAQRLPSVMQRLKLAAAPRH